ncbi:MAG: elongation factor G [Clostridia bacterium]|nr:elongation factor G [Clostridia bacterium]
MAKFNTNQIRNVAFLGHGGSGKTSLAEAMLYMTKATDRLGTPTDGNTVLDYDPEEIKRGFSISLATAPVVYKNTKINVLDAPGFLDFSGEVFQAVRVADAAIIVIDARSGVQVGAELAWDYATDAGIPKIFFINKFDDPEAHFTKLFDELREKFGHTVCPLFLPMRVGGNIEGFLNLIDMKTFVYDKTGHHTAGEIPADFADVAADYKNMLLESLAETSDELMEKFFAEEEITRDEAVEALHTGIINGSIVPVICGSSTKLWSIEELLDIIVDSFPRHTSKKNEKITVGGETKDLPIEGTNDVNLFVFKTIADQFGKQTFFKVMTGELNNTMTLRNVQTGASEKMAHIYTVCGKKQVEVDSLACGDIGMIPKLTNTGTNDTLTSGSGDAEISKIQFPEGFYSRAITPKSKGDEDKISTGVNRLLEEDKTLKFKNDPETNQLVVTGMGDMQLSILSARLESRSKVSVDLTEPKIAYREAIKKKGVQVQGKHKKQSGGHGQYGDVRITFGPGPEGTEGLTFTESVVGGAVPKGYFPAVEKGLQEAMQKGILAGFPMVNLSADLYDGSYHDVDSSEMAFKLAANLAYKAAMPIANPVILEPVGTLKVYVPADMLGDAMGDLNKRRGRVLGMSAMEGKKGYQVLEAEVPFSEMTDYTIALRAMTQGKGSYTLYFVRYEEVPAMNAQKIIEQAKRDAEEEK